MSELTAILASRSLRLVQVPADGDCFYHAIHKHLANEEFKDKSARETSDANDVPVSDIIKSASNRNKEALHPFL